MPKMTSLNPEWYRRNERWKHNSYLGHCAMARMQMAKIAMANTVTPAACKKAMEIRSMLDDLAQLLKERVDG